METTNATAPSGSPLSRMFNMLAAPGETIAEIADRPVEYSNWLVPAAIWAVIGSVMALLLFSQPWALAEITRIQDKAMEKQVALGKISQAQADQSIEAMHRFMPMAMKVFGVIGSVVGAFLIPIIWGLIIWLVANKVCGADIEYMKGVEAAALAMGIYLLAAVVGTLVSFVLGHLQTISAGAFVQGFDATDRSHVALAALNPFYLWYMFVAAVSVSVLTKTPLAKPLIAVTVIWVLMRALFLSNPYTMQWVM